jgi:hypothetical protein
LGFKSDFCWGKTSVASIEHIGRKEMVTVGCLWPDVLLRVKWASPGVRWMSLASWAVGGSNSGPGRKGEDAWSGRDFEPMMPREIYLFFIFQNFEFK